jgi:cytochrome P450
MRTHFCEAGDPMSTALARPESAWPTYRAGLPLAGNLLAAARSPLRFFSDGVARAGEVFDTTIGTFRTTVVVEPAVVEAVLKTNADAFVKDVNTRGMRWLLGLGMLTADGEEWSSGRKSATRDFQMSAYVQLLDSLHKRTAARTSTWSGGPVDVSAAMADLSLELITDHLFGPGVTGPDDPLLTACLRDWAAFFEKPFHYFVLRSPWPPLPSYRRLRTLTARLDAWLEGQITAARSRETPTTPFERIAHFQTAAGAQLSARSVRDQLITLILTGHETTANAMSWTLRFLAEAPDVQDALRAALPPPSEDPRTALEQLRSHALPQLLEAVALEGVRLRPPAWCIGREASRDVEIAGRVFPKGSHVTIPLAVMHMNARNFAEPERFSPARWLDQEWRSKLHRFAFLPFGGGPRVCLGQSMAMVELQWLLWNLVKRFTFTTGEVPRPEQVPSISLRPERPITLIVHPR